MQSWGVKGKFTSRTTEMHPTKSGIVGLLAAAQGRRRTDPIDDLATLRMGVRVEQPGRLMRDFQTATRPGVTAPLSYRYYLSDAVFLAAIEGQDAFMTNLRDALSSPTFPLFLGRRAFPPSLPLELKISSEPFTDILAHETWMASESCMKSHPFTEVRLRVVRDAVEDEIPTATLEDFPVSFDPNRRVFSPRPIVDEHVTVANPLGRFKDESVATFHDPLTHLGDSGVLE